MNEVQLIRNQLALERAHVSAVANACAQPIPADEGAAASGESLGAFRRACVDYLACVLAWFEERDQRLADLLELRLRADPVRRATEEVLARPGRSRDALAKLEAACARSGTSAAAELAWREFAEYFNAVWNPRRDALETLLASNAVPSEWRTLGGIDADSILEERRRYAQVLSQLPPAVKLGTSMDRA